MTVIPTWSKIAHKLSYGNREILDNRCSCFHCCAEFGHKKIVAWVDKGKTALCPKCGIDSVIPADVVRGESLKRMRSHWFGRHEKEER